ASPLLVSLAGAQLVLAMYYLVGGLLLVTGALLPLPPRLRALSATLVGAVPIFVAAPVLELAGWRGLSAALVFLALPGALVLRARSAEARLPRAVVPLAVLVALAVYLVPDDGVMPLAAFIGHIRSGSLTFALAGLFFLVPLVLV